MELMKVNDLEEKILGVWSTSDDIDLLLDWISDHVLIYDDAGEDELMNLLMGIKSLHHQRCHALFKDFEKVLANSKRTENSRHERAPGESGRDMSSDDEIGIIATAVANAADGEDFTTYAPSIGDAHAPSGTKCGVYAPSGAPIRTAEGLLA